MRLATLRLDASSGVEEAAIRIDDRMLPFRVLNDTLATHFATDLFSLLQLPAGEGSMTALHALWTSLSEANREQLWSRATPIDQCRFGPLYRHPRKIWGIGLNYREHAGDLHEQVPTEEPASFMKADTTIIGPGDAIQLPRQSQRTTAEAEIAVVIGRTCRNVSIDEALDYVAGFTPVIDMTAEDILEKNPRFLTRSKNFDTFFSFGPELVTPDELPNLHQTRVATWKNGAPHRDNVIANMTFLPAFLVAFHSQVMTLLPGDILSTGTPGAVVIRDGDIAECRIEGFLPLTNPVRGWEGNEA
ncbi:fumarylacetoacetate hydrolase family protein [Alicyclobacillus cycloheptanicus]|uniref:2-keto-4-pentenoate hydratase/2-oxohepta-3-ene-1,7-dioic acid hydratase in catechol pathway n=1 Tax=Alicyclobacillus cycloheptanicus TaxID=1457 RepID=A0ABT9XIW6_9BACL|nr:fumarylacetoacetate hydrolase family protein [Alicyclobacillus cycloheptanicus]MDQ0190256.1 2-keto-4-pentenoate hydratase/2-oxohepta-3-ene-1,7-dioic acid hydratase in catechol pathway [Alicyclobacillus cycloheptanicus]